MSNIEILRLIRLVLDIAFAPITAYVIYSIHEGVKLSKNPKILKYSVFFTVIIYILIDSLSTYFFKTERNYKL